MANGFIDEPVLVCTRNPLKKQSVTIEDSVFDNKRKVLNIEVIINEVIPIAERVIVDKESIIHHLFPLNGERKRQAGAMKGFMSWGEGSEPPRKFPLEISWKK